MRTILLKIYDALVEYFASVDWQRVVFGLKILSLVISGLLFLAAVNLIIRLRKNIKKSLEMIVEGVEESALPKKEMSEKWQTVLDKLKKEDESGYKLAVIEADKMLDDLLKRIGCQGGDMGERLKQLSPNQVTNLDEIWQAHKVRNQIVHNPDFQLNRSQAQRAVEIFQRALEDLEAI